MNNVKSAERIRQLCKSRDMPVASLLASCGIRKGLMYDMEKLNKTPSAEILEQIAEQLGCSVDYLIGRTEYVGRIGTQENPTPIHESGMSMKDQRLVSWFRSLPQEKQRAILIAQDAPRGLL